MSCSHVLQQSFDHSRPLCLLFPFRELDFREPPQELPLRVAKQSHSRNGLFWSGHDFHLVLLSLVYPCHIFYNILHGWSPQQASNRSQRSSLFRRTCHIWQCLGHHHRIRQWYCLCMGQGQAITNEQDVFAYLETSHVRQFSKQPRCFKLVNATSLLLHSTSGASANAQV